MWNTHLSLLCITLNFMKKCLILHPICVWYLIPGILIWNERSKSPSMKRCLTVVEGFVCPSDPRDYVVQGLLLPTGSLQKQTGPVWGDQTKSSLSCFLLFYFCCLLSCFLCSLPKLGCGALLRITIMTLISVKSTELLLSGTAGILQLHQWFKSHGSLTPYSHIRMFISAQRTRTS